MPHVEKPSSPHSGLAAIDLLKDCLSFCKGQRFSWTFALSCGDLKKTGCWKQTKITTLALVLVILGGLGRPLTRSRPRSISCRSGNRGGLPGLSVRGPEDVPRIVALAFPCEDKSRGQDFNTELQR